MMTPPADVLALLQESGLPQRGALAELLRPSIRLRTAPVRDDGALGSGNALGLGASKVGGFPDLPEDLGWPLWNGRPLAFLAQVDLQECAHFVPGGDLPGRGLLSFFYDTVFHPHGHRRQERGAWRVLYAESDPVLLKRQFPPSPLPEQARFPECRVAFSVEWTLPEPGEVCLEAARLILKTSDSRDERARKTEEIERYVQVREQLRGCYRHHAGEYSSLHRMDGYPDALHSRMPLLCERMTRRNSRTYRPGLPEAIANEQAWYLLLQLRIDVAAQMLWDADCLGGLYVWIRREDLATRSFGSTWCVLQDLEHSPLLYR